MTPDDVTNVMPPRNNAGITPQPRSNAVIAPGGNVRPRFNSPARIELRRAADQLRRRVLEPHEEQQQDQADLAARLDELRTWRRAEQDPPSPNARPASR